MELNLTMFNRNALKPTTKEQNAFELKEINQSINKGCNEMFKKYGTKIKVVECNFTNKDNSVFKVYYFLEVYQYIKHLKHIEYIRNVYAITTELDKLPYYIDLAKSVKRSLKYDLDLSPSKTIIL